MTKFTVRVLLHDAAWDDYVDLHNEMSVRGFTGTIVDESTGQVFELPPAEYNFIDDVSREYVVAAAKAAAAAAGRECAVLVSVATSRAWAGLREIKASKAA